MLRRVPTLIIVPVLLPSRGGRKPSKDQAGCFVCMCVQCSLSSSCLVCAAGGSNLARSLVPTCGLLHSGLQKRNACPFLLTVLSSRSFFSSLNSAQPSQAFGRNASASSSLSHPSKHLVVHQRLPSLEPSYCTPALSRLELVHPPHTRFNLKLRTPLPTYFGAARVSLHVSPPFYRRHPSPTFPATSYTSSHYSNLGTTVLANSYATTLHLAPPDSRRNLHHRPTSTLSHRIGLRLTLHLHLCDKRLVSNNSTKSAIRHLHSFRIALTSAALRCFSSPPWPRSCPGPRSRGQYPTNSLALLPSRFRAPTRRPPPAPV